MVEQGTEFAYDVFISYSHADKEWVRRWLLPCLEDAGLRVCIDFRDFDIGVPSLVNMERAVENSHRTLLVLTPAWVESEWTDFEVLLTQTTDPAGRRRRLLPILLQPCQPLRRIAMLTRADFTQPDNWDTQLQRVVAAVRGELRLPEVGPPLKQATLIRIIATGKFYLGEGGKARYIPDNPTLRAVEESSGAKGILDLSSSKELYEQYTIGDDLPSQAPRILQDSQGMKYLVARNEKTRIANDETSKALGGDPRHVRTKADEYLAGYQEGSPLPEELGEQWFTSKWRLVRLAAEYTSEFLVRGRICRYIREQACVEELRERLGIGPIETIDRQELEGYVEGIPIESKRDVVTALKVPIAQPATALTEPPLLVFVSSVIHGMEKERQAVDQAVRSISITRPWRFEATPASTEDVVESYLSKVLECDIFILLIGDVDSDAVRREYQTALDADKPVLAFIRDVERAPELDELVHSIRTKYGMYSGSDDLRRSVQAAVMDEVVKRYRGAIRQADTGKFVESLAPLTPVRPISDILGHVVFGLGDKPSWAVSRWEELLKVFGGVPSYAQPRETDSPFEDLYFDDFNEMKEVLASLNRAVRRVEMSDDPQTAFKQAWEDEVFSQASHFMVRRLDSGTEPPASTEMGLKYLILGVHRDYSALIRLLRTREVVEGPTSRKRDAQEFVFEDATVIQQMATVLQRAQRDSRGDFKEWRRLVIEGAMRVRISHSSDMG